MSEKPRYPSPPQSDIRSATIAVGSIQNAPGLVDSPLPGSPGTRRWP
jgi:hypothetical protein